MSFIADCCLADRDKRDQQVLEAIEPDFYEGKADFAFGKMPTQPNNQVYMDGWMSALREGVRFEGEIAVYPEATYRANATSDLNGAIFANVPFVEF